jgi:large subunit ribosomal protein L15
MPLFRRLPRRGFSNLRFKKVVSVVNVGALEAFAAGEVVGPERLREAGLVPNLRRPIKLLGNGELTRKLEVHVHLVSGSARSKIEAAGGTVVIQSASE